MPPRAPGLILFLSGLNLVVIQFVCVRNLASALLGTEVILFLAAFSYFLGFSAGYFVSDRLAPRGLAVFAGLQWATHLTLPFSLRWVSASLSARGWELAMLACALLLGGFWLSSFYSVLLPRFLRDSRNGEALSRLYGLEVLGGLAGMGWLFVAGRIHPGAAMVAYQVSLAVIVGLLLPTAAWRLAAGFAALGYAAAYGALDRASLVSQFKAVHGREVRHVLLAADTPYQRVEVIEDSDGERHLYLDGMRHYGSGALGEFNYFIAGLPSALTAPGEAVVVGSGSFEAVRHALGSARTVTSVELDPVVAEAGLRLLSGPFPEADRARWALVIDDAKHYLALRDSLADLLALDVAGPFQRQVALLYTREFFALARSRLRRGGLVAVCLNSDFEDRESTASRIIVTLGSVFEDVFVVTRRDGDSSFAYAGDATGLTKADFAKAIAAARRPAAGIYDRKDAERLLEGSGAEPIGAGRMDIVARAGWRKLKRRFF